MLSNPVSEQEFFGTVVKLLARSVNGLTLGEIKNRTRAMRRARRISDEQVFRTIKEFVDRGFIGQSERAGHVVYVTKMREKLREDFFDEDAYVEKPFRCTELSATEKENALKIAFMYKRKKELGTIPDNKQESVRQMLEHEWLEEKKKIITIPVSQEEHTGFSVTPQCEEPKIQETEIVSGQITTRQLINRDIKNNGANPMMFRESVVAKLVEEYKTQKINLNVQFPKEVLASTSYAERKEIKARLLKHYEDDPLAGLND